MIARVRAAFASGKVGKDAVHLLLSQVATLVLAIVPSVLVARALAPAQKGTLDIFRLIGALIADFGTLGMASGLLYFVVREKVAARVASGTGLAFSALAGGVTALVGLVALPLWRRIFPGIPDWMLLSAFALAPPAYYSVVWFGIMTALDKVVASRRVGVYASLANGLLVFALWGAGRLSVVTVAVVIIGTTVGTAALMAYVLYTVDRGVRVDVDLGRRSLRFGLVTYVGALANVLHFKVDQGFINYWLGAEAVGVYALSVRWAEMLFMLDSAITSASLFRIASSSAESSTQLTGRVFRIQLGVSAAAGAMLALVAYPLILTLYGAPYRGAVVPMVILIPGVVAWSAAKVLSNMLVYNRSDAAFVTYAAVLGCALNVVFNVVFVRVVRLGIAGSALASSLSYTLVAAAIYLRARATTDPCPTPTRT